MQLDHLQVDLRPRSNAQALDLGFAILRQHAITIYLVWLSLWLPLITICAVLAIYLPPIGFFRGGWWMLVAWWLRPWLERAPLYILSRQMFGETITWQQALHTWPQQLGGGFLRLLWWRPFAAGRGIYQPIWQLEGARGKAARNRMRIIGKHTLSSATWFGVACAHFEAILQLGFIALVNLLLSDEGAINPIKIILEMGESNTELVTLISFSAYAIGVSIIGPIYVACCFTLYLNRRATLEAWDIEIVLRQLKPVVQNKNATRSKLGALLTLMLVCSLGFSPSSDLQAKENTKPSVDAHLDKCKPPILANRIIEKRNPVQGAEQEAIRKEIDTIYLQDDLVEYRCIETWQRINKNEQTPEKIKLGNYAALAKILKFTFIGVTVLFLFWLLYRYRGQIFGFDRKIIPHFATEVGGLDIRPESLPKDIPTSALALWEKGEKRAAIALLYRASLSRLVEQYGLQISKGMTENDCLRLTQKANEQNAFKETRHDRSTVMQTMESCTRTWLESAYAHRFPNDIVQLCRDWKQTFDASTEKMEAP